MPRVGVGYITISDILDGIDALGSLPASILPAKQGGLSNIIYKLNQDLAGNSNPGELCVFGDRLAHPDGTDRYFSDTYLITPFGESGAKGFFYVMWSDTLAHTRLGVDLVHVTNSNFMIVAYNGSGWEAVKNNNSREGITLAPTDCFLAACFAENSAGGEIDAIYPYTSGVQGYTGPGFYTIETATGVFPANATATTDFTSTFGQAPVEHNHLTYVSTDRTHSETKRFDGSGWIAPLLVVNGDALVKGTITSEAIATGEIKATNIAASAVTTSKISANAVNAGKIAANTITANEIAAGTITANEINTADLYSQNITATGAIRYESGTNFAQLGGGNLIEAQNADGPVFIARIDGTVEIDGKVVKAGSIGEGSLSEEEIARLIGLMGTVAPATGGSKSKNFNVSQAGGNVTATTTVLPHGSNVITVKLNGSMTRNQPSPLGDATAYVTLQEKVGAGGWTNVVTRYLKNAPEVQDGDTYWVDWRISHETTRNPTADTDVQYRATIDTPANWGAAVGSFYLLVEEMGTGGATGQYVLPTADGTTKGGVALDTNYFYLNGEKLTPVSPTSGNWWRGIPRVQSGGVMEVGKHIDFHNTDTTTADNDFRITSDAGTLQLSGKLNAPTLGVTAATGTAPFTVNSTTKVTNLNADLLDGLNSSDFGQLAQNQTVTGLWTFGPTQTFNGSVNCKGELNYTGASNFYIDNQVNGSETFLRGRTSIGEIHTTLLSVMGGAGSSDLQLNHNNTRVAQTETGGMIFGEDIGNTGYVRIRQVAGNGYVHASQGHLWLYSDGAGKNVQVQIRNTDSSYDTTFQVLPGASAGTSYVRLNYGDTQKLITTATGTTTNGASYVTGDVDVDADINVKGELNYTGTDHFYIENEAENKHIYIRTTHSGGKDTHIGMVSQADPYLDLKRNNITVARTMPGGLRIGGNLASDFLDVVHDGFNGYMYNYKGHMYLYNVSDGSNLYLTVSNDDGSTDNVVGVVAGTVNGTSSVELYYGDSRKLFTGTSGTYLDDDLIVNGGHHINASGGIYLEGELNYDGAGTFVIDNHTNDQDILMRTSQAGSRVVGLRMVGNTADPYVELYCGNLARFTTLNDGIRVGTSPYSKNVTVTHDNTDGWVKNSSGALYVKNNALGENLYLGVQTDNGNPDYPFHILAGATDNTSYVILKNGDTEKLRTTSSGIDVTGTVDADIGEFGSAGTTTTSLSVITNKIAFDSTPSASEASAFIQTGTAQVLFGQDAAGYPTIQGAGTGTAYRLSLNPTAGTVLVGDRIGFNNDTGKYLNRAGDFLQWTNQTGFVKLGVSQDNYTYINSDSLNGFYFDNGAIFRDQGGTAELRIEAPTLDTHEARLFLKSGTSNMNLFWRNSDKNFGAHIEGVTRLRYVHSTDNWHFSNNVSVQGLMTADIVRETSDERVKSDFAPITEALTKTRTLAGETYLQEGSDERLAGVRAQLVEKVLPEAIGYTDDETLGKKLSVKVSALPALLVEAVKELADKNDALEARVEKLERMMEKLTNGFS